MTQPADDGDDGGLLDRLDDVVDELLATDLPPPQEPDPWERRAARLDSWTAILLAVAAVATAWASFQASQWSGVQTDAQSASAIARTDAARASTDATRSQVIDSQTWLAWVSAVAAGDDRQAAFLRDRFSPELAAAQDVWLAGARVDADGTPEVVPPGTPLDLPAYVVPDQEASDAAAARAEALLAEADVASGNATRFVLLAVLLALVLFFASIATKVSSPKAQVTLLVVGAVLLVVSVVRLGLVPQRLW